MWCRWATAYLPEADAIAIGGLSFDRSKKWRDLRANPEMAFVVDDLASVDPWSPRGIEIRGRAELHDEGGDVLGPGFGAARLRVQARRIVSWGLGAGPSGASARSVS